MCETEAEIPSQERLPVSKSLVPGTVPPKNRGLPAPQCPVRVPSSAGGARGLPRARGRTRTAPPARWLRPSEKS